VVVITTRGPSDRRVIDEAFAKTFGLIAMASQVRVT
jgi:hypothetical protein